MIRNRKCGCNYGYTDDHVLNEGRGVKSNYRAQGWLREPFIKKTSPKWTIFYLNLLLPIYNSYFSLKRTVDLQSIDLVIGLIVTSDSDTCFSVLECLCLSQLVLYDEIKTWNEAYDICQNSGGRLVSVDSDEKYALLGTYSRSEPWKSASGMWVTLTNSKIPQDLNAANSYTVLLVFFKNHYLYQSKAVVLIVTIFGSIYLLDKAISWFERLLRYM